MGNPAKAALKTFFGDKHFVYGHAVDGNANNPNADIGNRADCTYLAFVANNQAGYNVPYLATSQLVANGQLTSRAARYYEQIPAKDAGPGDMLVFNGHVMLIQTGNGIEGTALGAQSTQSGLKSDEPFGSPKDYWGGKGPEVQMVLRPRLETYVPEKDLVGGPGTGLDSPKVAALVDLLKNAQVESFRPGIYADSKGIPTVGDGLALVVKGSNGWTLLDSDTLKGLFRTAGLDPAMVDSLPTSDLKRSAMLLNQGNAAEAKTVFGDGTNPAEGAFRLTAAQADNLAKAYVMREVVPKMINGLGDGLDPSNFNQLTDGQFAAIGSRVYQMPGWLKSEQGKKFIDAWVDDNNAAAVEILSQARGSRGELEALAFNRPPSVASASSAASAIHAGGHSEDSPIDFGQGNSWDNAQAPDHCGRLAA
jgi:hypothetical protein